MALHTPIAPQSPSLPHTNIPEKIIFCVDISTETNFVPAKSLQNRSIMDHIKVAIRKFVYLKNFINTRHEFALILIGQEALWFFGFTNNIHTFIKELWNVSPTEEYKSCELSSLLKLALAKVPPPARIGDAWSYLVRCIVIYARSTVIPHLADGPELSKAPLVQYPWLFSDFVFLHQKIDPPPETSAQDVYDFFFVFETEGKNQYFFESFQNTRKLYSALTLLLSHPLQRPPQSMAVYSAEKLFGVTGASGSEGGAAAAGGVRPPDDTPTDAAKSAPLPSKINTLQASKSASTSMETLNKI